MPPCLHHWPDPAFTTVADDLYNIARFALRERPSNDGNTLFFPSHAQAFNRIGHMSSRMRVKWFIVPAIAYKSSAHE